MKKILYVFAIMLMLPCVFAQTAFDSNQKATEVKLTPAINTTTNTNTTNANSLYKTSIKEQKFNSALVNLDDAQVELREELATLTAKYNEALNVKNAAIQNCKNLKKEINAVNSKMKNVERSKKIINKNLDMTK